jgi:hypothetical protein
MTGKTVYTKALVFSTDNMQVGTQGLSIGVYQIVITNKNGDKHLARFIKQ